MNGKEELYCQFHANCFDMMQTACATVEGKDIFMRGLLAQGNGFEVELRRTHFPDGSPMYMMTEAICSSMDELVTPRNDTPVDPVDGLPVDLAFATLDQLRLAMLRINPKLTIDQVNRVTLDRLCEGIEVSRKVRQYRDVRAVSIQGKGYDYRFTTNATPEQLGGILDKLSSDFNTGVINELSDDSIVPALRASGYVAWVINDNTIPVSQIISADW
jgi:hypothetical protein